MYKSLALRDIRVPKSSHNLHMLRQRLHLQQRGHNLGYACWTLPTEGSFAPQELGKRRGEANWPQNSSVPARSLLSLTLP